MNDRLKVGESTAFSEIYRKFQITGRGGDKHIRFKGQELYLSKKASMAKIKDAFSKGTPRMDARARKHKAGAAKIKEVIGKQYGGSIADRVFQSLNLEKGVRRSDLTQIAGKIPLETSLEKFRQDMAEAGELLQARHSLENFTETCIQTMSDESEVQTFLRENLNNPDYSGEHFTGIDAHPSDQSKFIARFGEKRIVLSNRGSSAHEFRGAMLRDQLARGGYRNLGELIGQNYLSRHDSMLAYAISPAIQNLRYAIKGFPRALKSQIIQAVAIEPMPIGNSTVGEVFGDMLRD